MAAIGLYSPYQESYRIAAGYSMFRRAGVAITVAIPTTPHHTEYPKTLRPRVPGGVDGGAVVEPGTTPSQNRKTNNIRFIFLHDYRS